MNDGIILPPPPLGPTGIRAQRILEMGLARAAERTRRVTTRLDSPVASPSSKKCDSPASTRPGETAMVLTCGLTYTVGY